MTTFELAKEYRKRALLCLAEVQQHDWGDDFIVKQVKEQSATKAGE